MNYAQIKAIEKKNKERILKVCPNVTEESGIYKIVRVQEYAYIGQAKHLLSRLASHLSQFAPIDLSIKKRGFFSKENAGGYAITFFPCKLDELDLLEKACIERELENGTKLYNKTSGGQGEGKEKIADYKPPKGYQDGLKQGRTNTIRELKKLFERLSVSYDKESKIAERYYNKLMELIKGEQNNE